MFCTLLISTYWCLLFECNISNFLMVGLIKHYLICSYRHPHARDDRSENGPSEQRETKSASGDKRHLTTKNDQRTMVQSVKMLDQEWIIVYMMAYNVSRFMNLIKVTYSNRSSSPRGQNRRVFTWSTICNFDPFVVDTTPLHLLGSFSHIPVPKNSLLRL